MSPCRDTEEYICLMKRTEGSPVFFLSYHYHWKIQLLRKDTILTPYQLPCIETGISSIAHQQLYATKYIDYLLKVRLKI